MAREPPPVTALPKPEKRPPKPRKRIPRASKRKSAVTREDCHKVWSRIIRKRAGYRCEVYGVMLGAGIHVCKPQDRIDAMHGFPKKTYPAVRFELWNGISGCRSIHAYFHAREPEWQNILRHRWGNYLYETRLVLASQKATWNLDEVLAQLTELEKTT